MEQYELAPRRRYGDLVHCVREMEPAWLYIRNVGSRGGRVLVNEDLEGKVLGVKRSPDAYVLSIDDSEVFRYLLTQTWDRRLSLGYYRYPDETGRIPMLSTGYDPYDVRLPPVETSVFRTANMSGHYMEIRFSGQIPLKFHSWWKEPHWKWWCVEREKGMK
ncbi:hypothetical protein KY362_00280 [Candidatus Woesearchaeota archaeon]|nr:hypothetical protein [Candidatus Woesearchaeota archaeon]